MFETRTKIRPGRSPRQSMLLFAALSSLLMLLTVFTFESPARAQINCQSEIYLPAKTDPEDRFKKGYCFIQLGQFREGVTRLTGLETELPLIADYVIYYQGAGYENLGDYANAAAQFNKVIAGYPESGVRIKTLARLGNIYTQTGDYSNAERIFRSLYAEETDRDQKASYLESLGQAYEKQGKYPDAVNTYKQVWVEFPETRSSSSAQTGHPVRSDGVRLPPEGGQAVRAFEVVFRRAELPAGLLSKRTDENEDGHCDGEFRQA
jgi:tetratricopeptide (TPR) repeat protein